MKKIEIVKIYDASNINGLPELQGKKISFGDSMSMIYNGLNIGIATANNFMMAGDTICIEINGNIQGWLYIAEFREVEEEIEKPESHETVVAKTALAISKTLKETGSHLMLFIDRVGMAHVDLGYGGHFKRLMSLSIDSNPESNKCWKTYIGEDVEDGK